MRFDGALFLAVLAVAGAAGAQTTESPEALQAEAQAAFDRGDPRAALALARRASAVRASPRLIRFMAVMQYELGELPEAVDQADRCVLASQASEDPADRTDTLGVCQRMAAELGAQVGRLVVRVPPARTTSTRVFVQGAELPRERWGAPIPLRPGAVAVEAREGDAVILRRELTLAAGAREAFEVPPPLPLSTPPPRALPVAPPPPPAPSPSVAPWIVAGAGAALFLGGNLVFLARDEAVAARDAACPMASCPDATRELAARGHDSDARAWQTAGYVTMGLGAAAIVGGVVWGVVGLRRARASEATVTPVARAEVGGAVLGVTGTF